MMTSTALEGGSDQGQASTTGEGGKEAAPLPNISALSKILVAVAGPAMNVIFAFVLATVIYFVGLPVPVNPPSAAVLPWSIRMPPAFTTVPVSRSVEPSSQIEPAL